MADELVRYSESDVSAGDQTVTEAFLKRVKDKRAREALRGWAERSNRTLQSAGWEGAGYTSAQLLGAYIPENGVPRGVVVKINPHSSSATREPAAHDQALRHPTFAAQHLVDLTDKSIGLPGGGSVSFQRVAGHGFNEFFSLRYVLQEHDEPAYTCQLIVKSLLTEWNARTAHHPKMERVGPLLRSLLGGRIEPGGTLRQWAGRHAELLEQPRRWLRSGERYLVNPFALAVDDSFAGDLTIYAPRGHSHGDLHPDNLLVAKLGSVPLRFQLIDLSRYSENGLLAWDPAYLMLTTAATFLPAIDDDRGRESIRRVLLRPSQLELLTADVPTELRRAIKGIASAEDSYVESRDMVVAWRNLRLVCMTAIGLILSGRGVLAPRDREWYFWLSAHAATELLHSMGGFDPSELWRPPDQLIDPSAGGGAATRPIARPAAAAKKGPFTRRRGKATAGTLLDRKPELRDLRSRLNKGPWGVVVVQGDPGVGKSTLVDAVLAPAAEAGTLRIRRHEALPRLPLDVRTLTDDLDNGTAPADVSRFGLSSVARFEAALDAFGDQPVVIVIESAENLIHAATGELADLDLDEAFELLATETRHQIMVVLVTRARPQSQEGGTWATAQPPIVVPGLPISSFLDLLTKLDQRIPSGLARLPRDEAARLHRAVRGNPRLAELAYAVLTVTQTEFLADTLTAHLAELPDVPRGLADLLVRGVSPIQRRVLDALAAFSIPVDGATLISLLGEEFSPGELTAALAQMKAHRVVRSTEDQHCFLPPSDVRDVLNEALDNHAPGSVQSELLRRAAYELRKHRATQVDTVADLQVHFAELAALLRAGRYSAAYPVITEIDDALREWNCSHLLFDQRKAVQGRLRDVHNEMANDNQLGRLHGLHREFDEASKAYGRALDAAKRLNDDVNRTKLRSNLAAMYWQRNETGSAHAYYDLAREEALRCRQPMVWMGALEGMGDCRRRWGQYAEAIQCVTGALEVPGRPEYPDTQAARNFASTRGVRCALKLARWHAELGHLDEANEYLKSAEKTAKRRSDQWLLGACLDGRADLELSQGRIEQALWTATKAEDHALRLHDPVTLLQARTTLCMAYLMDGKDKVAARQIERARRYRHAGHSLVVLALLALVARQQDDDGKADARFEQLRKEAMRRIDSDGQDFGALDFYGFALCGLHPEQGHYLDGAMKAFRAARVLTTQPTPGLVDRLEFLLDKLAACDGRVGRLQPAIDALRETDSP